MAGLDRSRLLLGLLKEHLDPGDGGPADPLIEAVVVNYLLTTVYADLEIQVRSSLVQYGHGGADNPRVQTFINTAVTRVIRSIKCSDLAGALAMFDDRCKRHFQEALNNTVEQAAYDRLVLGRHDQSHNLGSSMP